jgi:GNAT superfamily N-acetyltransferase
MGMGGSPPRLQLGEAGSPSLTISLVFLVGSDVVPRLKPGDTRFGSVQPAVGYESGIRLLPQIIETEDEVDRLLATLRAAGTTKKFILVSDRLAARTTGAPQWGPTDLAMRIRHWLQTAHQITCALVAMTDPGVRRVRDIDVCVPRDASTERFDEAILAAATAIGIKSQPVPRRTSAPLPTVRPASSIDEIRQCLTLRKHVYGLLHYLSPEQMDDPSGLELDAWDDSSIHFAALERGRIVGSVRLVLELPPTPPLTIGINLGLFHVFHEQRSWIRTLVRKLPRAFRERFDRKRFLLPILQSTDFESRWRHTLERIAPAAEISRVVVAPDQRGRGISRPLITAAKDSARELRRRAAVLECIPAHQPMYEQYGFRRIPGVHSRDADLDQYVVAMQYGLESGQDDRSIWETTLLLPHHPGPRPPTARNY